MELVFSLQRICSILHEICSNIENNINRRYKLWTEKKLRSRGRQNYVRMLNVIPFLRIVLITIINKILSILISVATFELNELKNKLRSVYILHLNFREKKHC